MFLMLYLNHNGKSQKGSRACFHINTMFLLLEKTRVIVQPWSIKEVEKTRVIVQPWSIKEASPMGAFEWII